ncbi:MAG TPA: hypothetical protein VNL34_03435 [Candidatus Nitrosotenuis sp.]|nr:hypothetical protein [Candidatus Nitrosotenuis sp.]
MTKIILAALFVLTSCVVSQTAFAYQTADTLEKYLANEKLASEAVKIASMNKGAGSGTPYFAADGVLGASSIAAAVFGGIAATFFIRSRHGRYVEQGRG